MRSAARGQIGEGTGEGERVDDQVVWLAAAGGAHALPCPHMWVADLGSGVIIDVCECARAQGKGARAVCWRPLPHWTVGEGLRDGVGVAIDLPETSQSQRRDARPELPDQLGR